MRTSIVLLSLAWTLSAQDAPPGRAVFESRCARCHGGDGAGGERGPNLLPRLATRNDQQLAAVIREGIPGTGMPASQVTPAELTALTAFLRSIQPRGANRPVVRMTVQTTDGKTLDGQVLAQGFDDLQLRTSDQRIHLLRRAGNRYREVTSEKNWPSYNGELGGNRFTTMDQITPKNVTRLGPKWIFPVPGAGRSLQVTPLVVDGIMYVAATNECFALDAGTGRQIWRFQRPRLQLAGDAGNAANRGVAIAGDRLFMVGSNAHILALNRFTGEQIWDTEIADTKQNYFTSSAPLAVGNLVVTGPAGGEGGSRGFVAAYDQATGKEVWRFWTVPLPGEPKSETWQGDDIVHGGAPTWFTGTYDAQLDTVYWPTGNPAAEYNGDQRKGDNLYSDSILALDAKTGKLKWYYQFTPHDLWDWDATETPMLVDTNWQGQSRKLMLQANRNGFFYVFDRTDGKLLLAKPFLREITWASSIGADGRPVKLPNQEPTAAGTRVCPSQDGATNWFSPSFNPAMGLYFIQTFEKCSIYTKRELGQWESGKNYLGGVQRTQPDDKNARELKAIDIHTGKVVWELPQPGPANSWGGTIATSTGLVIFGEEGGALMAADAKTGKPLWSFPTNQSWHASPMTYMFDGKQYIGVVAGSNVMAFGILD